MLPDRSDEVDKLLFMNSMEHTVVKNGKLISLSWLKTVTLPKITKNNRDGNANSF